ncbi:transcriptional repressor [Desulfurispira natronophila]|uniref:Fur family peroxide stress response transcriptional regulator n=1 Tax=Desulfurispira natronophila TaxID=682562 RepID=A0A7W8DHG4_9BACT|nr:Fur family peroxide stress response transcriptional regulator [Desulfurispira natronophila]
MQNSTDEVQQKVEYFSTVVRDAGVKVTHQRLEIFREIVTHSGHPDVETIHQGVRQRIPTVSLDTVYRTLWMLLDLGLIATLGSPRERTRFDANTRPHHHFICKRCGIARDFYSVECDQITIPPEVHTMGSVEKTQVEIQGVCHQCNKVNSLPSK